MQHGFRQALPYPPYSIDLWLDTGSFDRELALVTDLPLAREAFRAAVQIYPDRRVTLRQVTRVIQEERARLG